jgi:DNA-directed RNA polymerase subunit RPC12/RpoP
MSLWQDLAGFDGHRLRELDGEYPCPKCSERVLVMPAVVASQKFVELGYPVLAVNLQALCKPRSLIGWCVECGVYGIFVPQRNRR